MPSLAGLKTRLQAFMHPSPPPPPPPPSPPVQEICGPASNDLTANLLARRRLATALDALEAARGEDEALTRIAEITDWRPGLAPEGDPAPRLPGLRKAAERLPQNLSVRASLAEALAGVGDADAARDVAISVVRDSRPRDLLGARRTELDTFHDATLAGTFFHSVDLGAAFLEGSPKNAIVTAREMLMAHWPDLRGKSVLDVGAFGGWFAFEAERRGAAQVTANDYYSWMVDFPLVWAWITDQKQLGIAPNPYLAPYPVNDPERQPGRALFDLTRRALGSRVEPVFGPVETAALEPHDIVLLLGVLYHHENPIALLRRAFDLTRETLILETLSFEYTAHLDAPIWHFYSPTDLDRDSTTIWAPSSIGLRDALLKVGFRRVELLYGWDGSAVHADWPSLEARLWVHAHR